ncbi:MAG: hypothetical protein HYZ85_04625 [Candidatus Omnitrophica bacterium]|nr:hypothetical protein [Candidatus Omnitrophota bacterium]
MSKTIVVLVYDRRGTQRCFEELSRFKEASWVVCDVRSQILLSEKGLSFITEQDLFSGEEVRLREDEELARDLSENWFKSLAEDSSDIPFDIIETYYTRQFFSYFLVLLRALHLLERIHSRYGDCTLVTTDLLASPHSIRWSEEESPIPCLLRSLGKQLYIKWEILDSGKETVRKKQPLKSLSFIRNWLRSLLDLKLFPQKAEVLLLGNPKLLGPVANELESEFKMNALRFRPTFQNNKLKSSLDENKIRSLLEKSRVFEIKGMDLFSLVWNRIKIFYQQEYPKSKASAQTTSQFLKKINPKVLLVDEDVTPYSKMAVSQARKLGILTIVVSHGLPGLRHGFSPLTADYIAVWGDFDCNRLQSWAISKNLIIATGNPKYDNLCKTDKEEGPSLKKIWMEKFGWRVSAPLILVTPDSFKVNGLELFADQMKTPEEVLMQAECFLKVAKEIPQLRVIYKIKQGKWDEAFYGALAKKWGGLPSNMKWVSEGTAVELIKASDLVFSGWASSSLETILLKKPLFLMHFLEYAEIFPFSAYGFKSKVKSANAVLEVCKKLVQGQLPLNEIVSSQECLTRPFLLARDGQAANRIASFVHQQLQ